MGKMRIFVSHHSGDNEFTGRLVAALEHAGAEVWWDTQNLGLGVLHDIIDAEIAARPVFLLVVSEGALASSWVRDESGWAYNRYSIDQSSSNRQRMILPVLAEDVDLQHMSGRMLGFLRIEAGHGRAYPQDRAIEETLTALNRAIDNMYYPTHVAKALLDRYEELGGASNSLLGPPLLVDRSAANPDTSPQGSKGYRHWHAAGNGSASIYWSERGGAQPVWGAIRQQYKGRGSSHGFPLTGEIPAGKSRQGTEGVCQRFEGDRNYPADITGEMRYGATIYWCPRYGAHTTWGGIGEYFEGLGGSSSWLGFPASDESKAVNSPYGTSGTYQRFEGDWDYPDDVITLLAGVHCGATVYYCEQYGAQPTGWGIGVIYERLYGTSGVLGFPTSSEIPVKSTLFNSSGAAQRFEGGVIYYRKQSNLVVPVIGAMNDLYEALGGVGGDFGFPLSPAEGVQTGRPGQSIQRFEGGIISSTESENSG